MPSCKSAGATMADLVGHVLKNIQGGARPSEEAVEKIWRRLAGIRAARHSRPKRLTKGRLVVEVENSGWLYTLNQRKIELTKGLCLALKEGQFKELILRIGEFKDA